MPGNHAHYDTREAEIDATEARIALNEAIDKDADAAVVEDASRRYIEAEKRHLEALKMNGADLREAPPELVSRASVHRYIDFTMSGKPIDGVEKELIDEIGVPDDFNGMRAIPLAVLGKNVERRTDVAIDLTAGDFATNLAPAVMPVFADTDIVFLGTQPQIVPVGAHRIPVIRDDNKATPASKAQVVDAAAATIVTREFNPKEIRKRFTFSVAEHHNWGRQIEENLTTVLRNALLERLDDMTISGNGTDPQPLGIYGQFKGTGLPSAVSTQTDWAGYVSALSDEVDGRYANDERGMRLLVGIKTWSHMRTKYRGSDSTVDAIQALRNMGADVRASARVAAPASNQQDAILALSQEAGRNGYWVGTWAAIYIVRDPFTASSSASVNLTATLFYDCGGVTIPDNTNTNSDISGMKRLRFRVA